MAYYRHPSKKTSPLSNEDRETKKRSGGKYDNYSGKDSPGNSPVSIEENENLISPYKNNIPPFTHNNQGDSLHNANPLNLYSSPVSKVMVTEAIKIGSARKVKDPALFDATMSITDNIKGGFMHTPPKRGYMESPKKENLVKSPHEITSEMYSSPIQSPIDPRKEYKGQVDDSLQEDFNNNFLSEFKKPLNEIKKPNNKSVSVTQIGEGSFPRNQQGSFNEIYSFSGPRNYNSQNDLSQDRQKSGSKYSAHSLQSTPERDSKNKLEQNKQPKTARTPNSPEIKLFNQNQEQTESFDNYEDQQGPQYDVNVFQKKPSSHSRPPQIFTKQPQNLVSHSQTQQFSRDHQKETIYDSKKSLGQESSKKGSLPEFEERNKEFRTLDHQPSFGEADTGSFTDINQHIDNYTPQQKKSQQKIPSLQENQLASVRTPTHGNRSDIWTPRSVVNSERSHKNKIPRGFEKDLGSKIDVNTMTSFITQPESVFLNKTNYSNDPCERIIKTLKKNRDKFVDNIFLASISSLVNSLKNNKKPEWKSLEWLRIPELYRQAKLTLYEEITPLSIKPGTLQNYDFLSVLAALSEYPDLVRKLVENQAFNNEGCYSVKVCRDGIWRYVVVDDFLPFLRESTKGPHNPIFLQANCNNEKKIDIWQMIYEKAWAKVFGTYQVLETTSIEQMLRDSTGAPCITYECKNMEEIWNILCEASAQGNIIIASTQEGNKKLRAEEIYKKGLNPLYGNTVLDVSLTRTSSEVRTIKLRNIWNSEYEWESKHKEPKSETFLQEKIIFMTIQEFFSIYSHIHVCHYNENFMYNHITMRHVPQVYSIAKFSTHVNSDCFFELTQIDHRFYRGDPKYQYSISRFLIFKIIDGQPYYIGGNISASKYNTLKMNITEGNYYVVGVLDWKGDVYDFNFSAYSEGDVYFERVHYNENPDIISQLFKPYIEEKTAARTPSRNKDFLKYEKTIDELQLRVELFVNNSNSKTLNLKKKISKVENASLLNIVPNEKNDIETQAFPQSSKLILVGSSQFSKPFVYVYEDNISEE